MREYSRTAMTMNAKQAQIHLTRAVVSPPDFGELLTTEFKVLIVQSAGVSKSPSLAGIASLGTTKLTYGKHWHLFLACLEFLICQNFNLGSATSNHPGIL